MRGVGGGCQPSLLSGLASSSRLPSSRYSRRCLIAFSGLDITSNAVLNDTGLGLDPGFAGLDLPQPSYGILCLAQLATLQAILLKPAVKLRQFLFQALTLS